MKNTLSIIVVFITAALTFSQSNSLFIPLNYQKAYDNGTRSLDGKPGTQYWQNSADYKMNISIEPSTGKLSGNEEIYYYNNSPDTLKELIVHLFPNIYKRGVARDFAIDPADESEGVQIESIQYNTRVTDRTSAKHFRVKTKKEDIVHSSTYFTLKLEEPLAPGYIAFIYMRWNYTLNKGSEIRTGTIDSTTFFFAYFFPRIAVYDDIDGWNTSEYTGQAEFYHDFCNFEVNVDVPNNYLVWGTGMLQNAESYFNEKYSARYKEALTSDKIVNIIDSTEYMANDIINIKRPVLHISNSGDTTVAGDIHISNGYQITDRITWTYKAENVTDFAFGTSNHFLWDATSYEADKTTGRRVFISAVYDKASHDYYKVADATKKVIHYLSTEIPGVPYPFSAMTVFNGHSGMEYPMMVNDLSQADSLMPGLTAHEVSHSYFPFYMGINETKYAYMDEGWSALFDYLISSNVFGNEYIINKRLKTGRIYTGNDLDVPVFSISKYLKSPVYRNNAYIKAAVFYLTLKDLLGDDLFKKTLSEFINTWNSKHPIPHDFFHLISTASGQDLSWLIKPWFFEFGYVDLAINKIGKTKDNYIVPVEMMGSYPAPIKLKVYYADGSVKEFSRKADVWKKGDKIVNIEVPGDKRIKRAELNNKFNLDVVPSNDFQEETEYN